MKKKRCSSEDVKYDEVFFGPEDLKNERSGPVNIDKLKEIFFDVINIMRKLLHLTEEIESTEDSDTARDSVFKKFREGMMSCVPRPWKLS